MKTEELIQFEPKLLAVIIDRDNIEKLQDILHEKHVSIHYMFNGMGTASSKILKSLGLSGTEKTICICVVPDIRVRKLMASIADALSLAHSGNGITFIIPVSGISSVVSSIFGEQLEHVERLEKWMDTRSEEIKEKVNYAMVISIINQGFSETLMDEARTVGARGGTIIHARRSGIDDAVKFFGVTLQAEKEIVAILVPREQKKELMQAITKSCGFGTKANGIVMSLPVESCSGINFE